MEVGALGWVRCRLVCSQNKFKLREVNKCEVHLSKHFPIELLVQYEEHYGLTEGTINNKAEYD